MMQYKSLVNLPGIVYPLTSAFTTDMNVKVRIRHLRYMQVHLNCSTLSEIEYRAVFAFHGSTVLVRTPLISHPFTSSSLHLASHTHLSSTLNPTPPTSVLQLPSQHRNLPLNPRKTRPSNRLPPLHARLKIEHPHHVLLELVAQALEVSKRELVELAVPRLSEGDGAAGYVVRFSEGDLRTVRDLA